MSHLRPKCNMISNQKFYSKKKKIPSSGVAKKKNSKAKIAKNVTINAFLNFLKSKSNRCN